MIEPFGSKYSRAYDLLYQDKDYRAECDLLESIFQAYGSGPIHDVLDAGCGTGSHAVLLAQRGYKVIGIDRSEHMLAEARKKAAEHPDGSRVIFQRAEINRVDLPNRFDAVLMMFAVLGYQLDNTDVVATLTTIRRHLRLGGLFLFEVWYGPAVIRQRPSQRIKEVRVPGGKILRVASGSLDTSRHRCVIQFVLRRVARNRPVEEEIEHHTVRFFFPLELTLLLETTGFALQRLGAFPDFGREPDEATWNVLGVARAV